MIFYLGKGATRHPFAVEIGLSDKWGVYKCTRDYSNFQSL
ncbi:hypothetical protein SAMN06295926_13144 [Lysinibacillus sp. AC-3]|nr:hypothetical protein SAMN06295926_13144 [Lysinibacillus sp. AC-3]